MFMMTLYERIGPEKLEEIVNRFYDIVLFDSKISHLFKSESTQIREKQLKFLTQFLGGPQLYSLDYGHPKMRMRHLPHPIDQNAKLEWLRCMKIAIEDSGLDSNLATALYNCFPPIAEHMVNR